MGRVDVEPALVERDPFAECEEIDLVGVVRDEEDPGSERLAVEARVQPVAVAGDAFERAEARERLAAPTMVLTLVDEARVDAE